MDEMTFTLHNPLTEEEWDTIEDVDFDHTNSITFHTKHGKDVEFIKRKTGKWIEYDNSHCECPFCHEEWSYFDNEVECFNYCPNCGAEMTEGE